MDETLFDQAAAGRARDRAFERVNAKNPDFMRLALAAIADLPAGQYQGEDIRRELNRRGIVPEAHQAYGALINTALRRGLLSATGKFAATKSVATHRHKTQIFAKAGAGDSEGQG